MFDRVVIATDGSQSVQRAVHVGIDVADRFDADIHAVYVLDADEISSAPASVREDLEGALERRGEAALAAVTGEAHREITRAVRRGSPASEIGRYAQDVDADLVVMGTRGRHGEGELLLGSVAEHLVRSCPIPVLTVRQLADEDDPGPPG